MTKFLFLWIIAFYMLLLVAESVKKQPKQKMPEDPIQTLKQIVSSGRIHGQQLATVYYQLGMHLQQGWFAKKIGTLGLTNAIDAFNQAIRNNVENSVLLSVQSYVNKGLCFKLMSQGDNSLKEYEAALSYELLPTDQALVHYNTGDTYLMLGNISQAIHHYKQSINLTPCKTERYFGYVSALREDKSFAQFDWQRIFQQLHHTEQHCINQYDKSFAIPTPTAATDMEEDEEDNDDENEGDEDENEDEEDDYDDETEDEMEFPPNSTKSVSSYFFPNSDDGYLSTNHNDFYYACYIVADKLSIPSLAWEALMKAKQLTLSQMGFEPTHPTHSTPFDTNQAILQKDNVKQIFTKDFLASFPKLDKKASKVPVFIIGMMRSGSTLLETMLDTHPAILGMGEDSMFNANLTFLRDSLVSISSNQQHFTTLTQQQQALSKLLLSYGKDTVQKMKLLAWQQHEQSLNSSTATASEQATVAEGRKKLEKGIKKIVDKMLFNYRNIGFLHMVYPQAVIINMLRDPLDTLFSCFRYKFNDKGLEWTLQEESLVVQYVLYLQYLQHFRTILPGRVLDIQYEQLVYAPETILPQVFERLQLSYNLSEILQFHQHKRVVQTNSQSQIRSSLYKHSIGSWRKYANHLEQIKVLFQKHLPELQRLNALPFPETLNWEMKEDFPYDAIYDEKFGTSTSSSSAASSAASAASSSSHHVLQHEKNVEQSEISSASGVPSSRKKNIPTTSTTAFVSKHNGEF